MYYMCHDCLLEFHAWTRAGVTHAEQNHALLAGHAFCNHSALSCLFLHLEARSAVSDPVTFMSLLYPSFLAFLSFLRFGRHLIPHAFLALVVLSPYPLTIDVDDNLTFGGGALERESGAHDYIAETLHRMVSYCYSPLTFILNTVFFTVALHHYGARIFLYDQAHQNYDPFPLLDGIFSTFSLQMAYIDDQCL